MSVFVSQSLCSFWWVTGWLCSFMTRERVGTFNMWSWTAECTGYRNREAPHCLKWCNTISVHLYVCACEHIVSSHPAPAPPHPQCSVIDYTLHTLLNSNKYFPSRITIKETSIPRLSSVARRIYRIFSHAYFHHRALYDQFEVNWSENDII